MPEMPEVETVRRYLESNILNFKINNFKLSSVKSLRNAKTSDLKVLIGQSFKSVERFAKHLIIRFNKHYIICHLRMEGKFFIFKDKKQMDEHTNRFHDVIYFETNKGIILFQDTRRFATVDLFNNEVLIEDNPIINKVGPEVFDKKPNELYSQMQRKRISIKTALLDQSIMSGLGNIYVDEVLFSSNIHPETKTNCLTIEDCKNIVKHSKRIIKKSIDCQGTTIKSYTSSLGVEGSYQKYLMVHQQYGHNCKICNKPIFKIKVGGRGTYFCEKCQKKIVC